MGLSFYFRRISAPGWAALQTAVASGHRSRSEIDFAFLDLLEAESSIPGDRLLDIDKEWHVLYTLLTGDVSNPSEIRRGPPPLGNLIMGGEETAFPGAYGMKRVLTPEKVCDVANALAKILPDDLISRFDREAFSKVEIYAYPSAINGWDKDTWDYIRLIYQYFVKFLTEASSQGDYVLQQFY